MEQYLKGNNMAPIKNRSGGYFAHAHIFNTYNSNLSKNPTKFLRAFMGQFFKMQFFSIINNHNGR